MSGYRYSTRYRPAAGQTNRFPRRLQRAVAAGSDLPSSPIFFPAFLIILAHVDNEVYLGRALEKLGDAALREQEPDIGAAFLKFAVVTKELSALMKTLVGLLFYRPAAFASPYGASIVNCLNGNSADAEH